MQTFEQGEKCSKTVNTKDKRLANQQKDLIRKHIKEFMKFTNTISLDEINSEQNSCKANR
jgi:hypothetical protein